MLAIILTILKVIGLLLLALLALVLLIVCLVLFVPIRYRVQGEYHDDYRVQARVTWLLHILSVRAGIASGEPFRILVRVLGIPVYDTARPPKEYRTKRADRDKVQPEPEQARESTPPAFESPAGASEPNPKPEPTPPPEPQIHAAEDVPEQKLSLLQKIRIFFRKIVQFLQNLEYTFRKIYDTIVDIKSNIHYYWEVLEEEETAAAWKSARKQVLRVWRSLRPRHWRVYLHIGRDDPAAMGDILGIWGALYPLHEGRVELEPDFERTLMEGELTCRGHVTLCVAVWAALVLFFDKNIKHLKQSLLREEK